MTLNIKYLYLLFILILNILDTDKTWQEWIKSSIIRPTNAVFSWTKTRELLSAKLLNNLQRSLSPKDNFFHWKKEDLKYLVIDKDKIPENFVKLFELNFNNADIENQVKDIFQKSRLLDKKSARIVFIEDKIVIFRNEERLVHKQSKWQTQWEKKRSEFTTIFNTFSNIYDAVRSQYYIIQNSEDKKSDMRTYQHELLRLAQEAKFFWVQNVKNWEWKRKIDQLIEETENARNFRVLAANLQNLQNLTLKNSSIDANLLEGAKNKFKNRLDDLQAILGVVNKHLNEMENILTEHENLLEMFLSQIQFADRNLALDNYQKWYKTLENKYWNISPFSIFFEWINKYRKDENTLHKFVLAVSRLSKNYKKEHKKKILWKDVEFQWFDEVKDNLRLVEEIILQK